MKKQLTLMLLFTSFLIAEELKVTSKSFQADEKTGISIFEGDVSIVKGSDELNASKITIFTNKKRKPMKYMAVGDVSFHITTKDKSVYEGKAQKVIYFPIKKEYHFYKNVHLNQSNNQKVIIGDEVVLKILDGQAYAKGQKNKPVIMIFDIDEKEKKER